MMHSLLRGFADTESDIRQQKAQAEEPSQDNDTIASLSEQQQQIQSELMLWMQIW